MRLRWYYELGRLASYQRGNRAFKRDNECSCTDQRASKLQTVKVSGDQESNPGHPESSNSLHKLAKNVASNPKCLNIFLIANFTSFATVWPTRTYSTSFERSDSYRYQFISFWRMKAKAMTWYLTWFMIAQSTLISYHTEAFVKTEVRCTVLSTLLL